MPRNFQHAKTKQRSQQKLKSVYNSIREVQFSELQICTSRCLLDVSTCNFECPKLNIPKTIHSHRVPTSVPYSAFPISINTYPIAHASNLTLPSQLFLKCSQILSNFPHYFSNLFSYVLLIQSISELRPVFLTGLPLSPVQLLHFQPLSSFSRYLTQVRTLPWLKSFDSLFEGRGETEMQGPYGKACLPLQSYLSQAYL